LFQAVEVKPAVDFGRLEELMVVVQLPPQDPTQVGKGTGK